MCMAGDYEPWDVFDEVQRTAAKDHRCSECGRTIDKGEMYHVARGLMDGYWSTFKTCSHCDACRRWLLAVCDGYLFEGVLEDLTEHRHEMVASWWLLRRIAESRKRWRRSDGSLYPVRLPRYGFDYPVLVTVRPPIFYSGRPNPELVGREQSRLALAVIKALWWGEWFSVDGLRQLRYASTRLAEAS